MRKPASGDALGDLAAFLVAADPYLDRVVFAGGWVPFLYRHLPGFRLPAHPPLLTDDFDLVTPERLPLHGLRPLDALLKEGPFVVHHAVDPPVLRYQHGRHGEKDLAPVHFEFLTALQGAETDRKGRPRILAEVQPGLHAQRLRYLELLLQAPLDLPADRVPGLGSCGGAVLRIPNPAAYLLQKALIADLRKAAKVRKDAAYIYEVALLWSGREVAVQSMAEELAGDNTAWKRWVSRARQELDRLFADIDADGPVSVEVEMSRPGGRSGVTAAAAFRVVRPFLERALGVGR